MLSQPGRNYLSDGLILLKLSWGNNCSLHDKNVRLTGHRVLTCSLRLASGWPGAACRPARLVVCGDVRRPALISAPVWLHRTRPRLSYVSLSICKHCKTKSLPNLMSVCTKQYRGFHSHSLFTCLALSPNDVWRSVTPTQ